MSEIIIDEQKENDCEAIIKAYTEKIEQMEKDHKAEIDKINAEHHKQVRAILTGQKVKIEEEEEIPEKTEEEKIKEIADRIAKKFVR